MQKKDCLIVRTSLRDISKEKKKLSDESRSTTHIVYYDYMVWYFHNYLCARTFVGGVSTMKCATCL